jgi:ubiquinol-cytochrome c reductase cytochrome b subunit
MIIYPWFEVRLTKDTAHHNLLQRPRDAPTRTAIGAMGLAFYLVLTVSCVNDIISLVFNISLNATTWVGRIGLLVLPPVAYYITYRVFLGLQRADRAVLEHGIETGVIKRLPHGEYIEVHQPLGPVDKHGHAIPLEYQGAAVPKKMNQLGSAGSPGSGSWFRADPPHQSKALAEAGHAGEHTQLEVLRRAQDQAHGSANGHQALDGESSANGHGEH